MQYYCEDCKEAICSDCGMFGIKVILGLLCSAPRPPNHPPVQDLQLEQEQDPELAGKIRPKNIILPQERLLHKALDPETDDPNWPEEVLHRRILPDPDGTSRGIVPRQETKTRELARSQLPLDLVVRSLSWPNLPRTREQDREISHPGQRVDHRRHPQSLRKRKREGDIGRGVLLRNHVIVCEL